MGFAVLALILGLGYWLWLSPVVGAADVRVHVRSAWVYYDGLVDGLDYPDWDATAYGGRGNPAPRFIGAAPLLFASFLQIFGIAALAAVKIVVAMFALLGLAGVYFWLVSIGSATAFPWAALFFMVHPLVSFHLGVAFLFQNLCAYFLSPWLWCAAVAVWRGDRRAYMFGGLAMGFIAWSHLYFAFMVGCAWVLLMLVSWLKTRQRRFLTATFLVPVLAMMFSAPYLLPAMLTSGDVYYEEVSKVLRPGRPGCEFIDEPVVNDKNQVLSWWQALQELTRSPEEGLPAHLRNTGQVTSILQMKSSENRLKALRPWLLLCLMLCFILACVGSLRRDIVDKESPVPLWIWLFVGSCCAFMSLRFAFVIYSVLPGAMAVQFPFRWLLPAFGLWIPLIAAGVMPANVAITSGFRGQFMAWFSRFFLVIFLLLGVLLQSLFWVLPDDSMKSFFAAPGHLAPFYPRAVPKTRDVPAVAGVPHLIDIASGSGVITGYQAGVAWFEARGEAQTPIELHINTHYDPGWRFTNLRTGSVKPRVDEKDGTMLLHIPAGSWFLTMERASPRGRSIGWLLMLVSLFIMAFSARQGSRHEDC
ncbi:MAG: hypothetical protein CVV42_06495 [Candidatus Riflebacteria bacterium HGW-Riflebacteria-2]|nr:MAG: hypothetical protein CVV42_06495 [Candidatus Riflebacteria bacterium HGW-Riflebacteria-2]